jgi:hypothetical protein
VIFEIQIPSFPLKPGRFPGLQGLFLAEQVIALGDSFAKEISSGYDEEVAERDCSKTGWVFFTRQVGHVCLNAIQFWSDYE